MTPEKNNTQLQSFDLMGTLPNLLEAQVIPADLTSEYWTPDKEGEFKLCFFQEIKNSTYTDEKSGETIELPCIVLLEQKPSGELKTIRNGSKRLVASLEDAVHQNKVAAGTPLRIEFLGKQKNATNTFQSDRWSVKPLYIAS
ncbi:hypothetical protein [Chryseobacterium sp.]|uniref:hypothetical protein n=1 Tax=Chryseobacterium sp. TaxID=1871047 RepID=UPI00321927A4